MLIKYFIILESHIFNFVLDTNISEQTLERKGYLRRVAKNVTPKNSIIVQDKNHLFHALLLIGLDLSSTKEKLPYIKYKYPEQVILLYSNIFECGFLTYSND